MALKSSLKTNDDSELFYQVLVEDDLAGRSTVKEISVSRCAELADTMLLDSGAPLDKLLGRMASVIAVRDYLGEIGEDPDFPTLG